MKVVRCAIYTRKSSDEGLEQDFNSLDAQREACAAYVLSQASEGWQLLPQHYDDGGVSGGTLERPALQRLLADVEEGRIDIIVVYKVDRLTRSLLDFAKLVEALDKAGTSFVSVTQSFNTTTSMGRLTLNMLLSFAQFEREVTAERIRDKLAASKAKGMWMGGTPPLGYRPDGRSLAIVEEHAAIVRNIYDRYLALGNVRQLAEQLQAEGIHAPRRVRLSGAAYGGVPFTRGQLYAILRNAVYAGDIVHKGKAYAGQHASIIGREQWDAVQLLLTEHVRGHRTHRQAAGALLAGKLYGPDNEPLISTHANKRGVRYRYYVSRDAHHGSARGSDGIRLPAREIEQLVVETVATLFEDCLGLVDRARLDVDPSDFAAVDQRCRELAATLRGTGKRHVAALVARVRVHERSVEIVIDLNAVADALGTKVLADAPATLALTQQVRLTRTGRAMRLVQDSGSRAATEADPALVGLVAKAHRWWRMLAEGEMDITALAERKGCNDSYITRVVRIAFLSPAVVEAILDGRQHGALDAAKLRLAKDIPTRWEEQAARYLPTSDRYGSKSGV